jgi:hypothetical protein
MLSLSGLTLRCHHCGCVCEPFLRQDFLYSSRFKPSLMRPGSF